MPRRTLKVEKDLISISKHVESAPVANLDKALPNTYYRRRNDKTYVFLTIMQDGLYVGWDSCGSCRQYVTLCKCAKGVTPPESVVYIHRQREQRISEGIAEAVTVVDKETVKPSKMIPGLAENQGQVSAPRRRPKRTTTAEQSPKPRKLRRIKKS